jgi:hypothetical protein
MSKLNLGISPQEGVIRVVIGDSTVTTGAGLTGLTHTSAGLIISTIKIGEAVATAYTQAAGNIESLAVFGTYETPTAGKCRFREVDATNHPGLYELHIADARFASDSLLGVTISGYTSLRDTTFEVQMDASLATIKAAAGINGSVFYVSTTGDNSTGLSWDTAKTTLDAAIALCTANKGDIIYVAPGTYDETAGGVAGVTCDVAGIRVVGIQPGVTIKNTDVTNAGKVFTITANNVWLDNLLVTKGEVASDNALTIDVNGAGISADLRDVTIGVEKANHTGIRITGGAIGAAYIQGDSYTSYIYSAAGAGIGVELATCSNCAVIDCKIHDMTTGITLTGGANCNNNFLSSRSLISGCATGISLTAGAVNNILSTKILNCTDEYDDNSGSDTNSYEGSLTYVLADIRDAITEVSPQTHLANVSSTVTHGAVAAGTYADTNTENDVYWQINPDAVNALDMYSQFLIGAGRTPSNVEFNGRFESHVARYCQVDAWNYITSAWETISSDSNRVGHDTSDFDRSFSLTTEHVKVSDGEMKIRVYSTSTTVGDDLYIDLLVVNSVASAAGGLTADAITTAVWEKSVTGFLGSCTTGTRLKNMNATCGAVSVQDSVTSFTMDAGVTTADAYIGMVIRLSDADNDLSEVRRIVGWSAARVVTVDKAFSFLPAVGDPVRILNNYTVVDTTSVEGSDATDQIAAACVAALTSHGVNTTVPDAAGVAAGLHGVTDGKIDTVDTEVGVIDGVVDAIKAKTDGLPVGFAKNVAFSNFMFTMVDADGIAMTGLTVAGIASLDGAAFAGLTNAVAEVGSGFYKVDLIQAEMNADIISFNFSATGAQDRNVTIVTDG